MLELRRNQQLPPPSTAVARDPELAQIAALGERLSGLALSAQRIRIKGPQDDEVSWAAILGDLNSFVTGLRLAVDNVPLKLHSRALVPWDLPVNAEAFTEVANLFAPEEDEDFRKERNDFEEMLKKDFANRRPEMLAGKQAWSQMKGESDELLRHFRLRNRNLELLAAQLMQAADKKQGWKKKSPQELIEESLAGPLTMSAFQLEAQKKETTLILSQLYSGTSREFFGR